MAVRPEPRGGAEVELRTSGVDQVVVLELAMLAGTGRIGIGDLDVRPRAAGAAFRVDRRGQCLLVGDALALVDRSELEGHLVGLHLADSNPDVRRDPVPVGVRGHHHDLVGPLQHPSEMECRRVAGDPSPQDNDSCHVKPPSVCLKSAYQIP